MHKLQWAADTDTYALSDKLRNRVDLIKALDQSAERAIVARESDVSLTFSYIHNWCEIIEL
jgi:hypothetical protein